VKKVKHMTDTDPLAKLRRAVAEYDEACEAMSSILAEPASMSANWAVRHNRAQGKCTVKREQLVAAAREAVKERQCPSLVSA